MLPPKAEQVSDDRAVRGRRDSGADSPPSWCPATPTLPYAPIMSEADNPAPAFPDDFDVEFPVGTDGNKAYFGRNVLRGLVDGIDDFIELRQPRWRQPRAVGPAMLASAMWIDDPELIDKLDELSGASVVVTKQVRSPRQVERMQVLQDLNDRSPGLPVRAFADLIGLGPTFDGKPTVLGPNDNLDALVVPTVRTCGYRKRGNDLVPIMHAKLALLGHLQWHDEDAFGNPDDIIWFTPQRLWISSANFTSRSRLSLEFGFWTEDSALVERAEQFLVTAMRYSEGLDPESDWFAPDLAPVDYDDEAFRDVLAEMHWDEGEDLR